MTETNLDPIQRSEARSVAIVLPDMARAIKVVDHLSRTRANDFFLKCREAKKKIGEIYDPHIERAKAAKKAADETRAGLVKEKDIAEAPIIEAEKIAKKEILRFDDEEDKRREDERRYAEAKARAEAEENALREAEDALAAGDEEGANAIIEEAIESPRPIFVPPPPPPPKLEGSAKYETWKFEVTDLKALVAGINSGKVPLSAVTADRVAINKSVQGMKGSFRWPGIKVWSEKDMRPTGR